MAVIDSLTTAKANLAATLATISASPKPTYSIDGQNVSWIEYHKMLTTALRELDDLIQIEGSPMEFVTRWVS